MTRVLGTLLLFTSVAMAQPQITGGPVNAASYLLAGLPNANIAQGAMFVLFGNNIGPAKLTNAFVYPLPTTLGGTSIQVTVGGTTTDAIMLFTVSSQVAAILPSTTPTGAGELTLTFNDQTSNTVPIHVVASTLGIFTRNQSGSGPGVLFNFNSQTDQPLNSLVQAAHPGQVMTLWGTGLGPVRGQEANGPLPGNLNVPVTVFVGTKQVIPTYNGRSGCCAGIDQVVFTVPDGVEGCYVSVNVVAGGVISNSATIAVTSNGSVCSDPTGLSAADLKKVKSGGTLTIGEVGLLRIHTKVHTSTTQTQGNLDYPLGAHFRNYASALDLLASVLRKRGSHRRDPLRGLVHRFAVRFHGLHQFTARRRRRSCQLRRIGCRPRPQHHWAEWPQAASEAKPRHRLAATLPLPHQRWFARWKPPSVCAKLIAGLPVSRRVQA